MDLRRTYVQREAVLIPNSASPLTISRVDRMGSPRVLNDGRTLEVGGRGVEDRRSNVMPSKRTIEKAREDKREGKSASTQAGEFVREEIEKIRRGDHGAR